MPQRFPTSVFSLRRYLWARAVLDARGHWWDGERHFVPLLDLVVLEPPLQVGVLSVCVCASATVARAG